MNKNDNKNTQFEYKITFTKKSLGDLKKLQKNKISLSKFNEIYEELKVNPYSPYFKFEKLKYNNSGLYSKRLNKKDRVVYSIKDEIITVLIISILGHYDDK